MYCSQIQVDEYDCNLMNVENAEALFVYESKLSLLIKISQSTPGTLILLGLNVLKVLTSCTFMDTRPEEIVGKSISQ